MVRVLLLLVLVLSGCFQADVPAVSRSDATGISGVRSSTQVVSNHNHYVVLARTMLVTSPRQTVWAVKFSQAYDGVHTRLRYNSAYAGGTKLAYRETWRGTAFCRGADCSATELGVLTLTQTQFRQAADTGLGARLIGPDGVLDVTVPPQLFEETLQIAAAQQLH